MIPGPLAALTYAAVKVVGYAGFARGLNQSLDAHVSTFKFGWAKTAIGLVGGLAYLFLAVPALGVHESSQWVVFAAAAPVRALAWLIALSIFFEWKGRRVALAIAVLAGVIWSYILDGVMVGVYQIIPGMAMPFC
jgi:hypothetical protein